ncbi:MAG: FAD:protein FMN transferase [Dehalococcoidia bacterium]
MDTDIDLAVAGCSSSEAVADVCQVVESLFERYEATLSRFLPDSELSALNRSSGRPFAASPLLFDAVNAAVRAAEDSAGIFDPCVLDALTAAGYDRTFALVRLLEREREPAASRSFAGAFRQIELTARSRTIDLPPGVHLDLGGIGKGLAVDAAARILAPFGSFIVNAGGDMVAQGVADDGPWLAGVQDPFWPDRDLCVLAVRDAAIATSSAVRRRWSIGATERHHLIDPRTGTSAESNLAAVTVIAADATTADALAKVALMLGRERAAAYLEDHHASALLVSWDGATETLGRIDLAGATALCAAT